MNDPDSSAGGARSERPGRGFPAGGVFNAALDAVIVIDADGLVTDWNPAATQLFGYTRDETIGEELAALVIPGPLRSAHRNALARHVSTGESTILDRRIELSALRRDGSELAVELAITRVPHTDPPLFAGFVRPITDRDAVSRENARLQQRLAFLAQAWIALDDSLGYHETLKRLVAFTVPELAQLSLIDLVDDERRIGTAVAAAEDPERAREVEAMRSAHPLPVTSDHPVARVLRSRQPLLLPEMTSEFLRGIAEGTEHFELMRRLRYHSAIVVPLVARERAIGTLSLLRLGGATSYDHDDLVLAQQLARRAALTVDNARLFESTRRVARTLQDNLLPDTLPDIPGVQLTARYRAAEQAQEVGGDFYDAFAIGEDAWGVAIGDVCGKGPEAAALTALARYTIRALADANPAAVLRRLNEALVRDRGLVRDRFLTALFVVVRPGAVGVELEIAAGGHPAPVVRRLNGTVDYVQVSGPLIGVGTAVEYRSARVELGPGDSLLLYTDGLTDARAPARVLSERDIGELLARAEGLNGDRLAAFVEDAATRGEDPRDDIALLVIEPAGDRADPAGQGGLATARIGD